MSIYGEQETTVTHNYPIYVKFSGEKAVDEGGVQRDMYTAFWDQCYSKLFEDSTTLVPMVHPGMDFTQFMTIGKIISHGYLVTGILPDRIVLPVLIASVLGPGVSIPDNVLVEAFADFLSITERLTVKKALECPYSTFQAEVLDKLISLLARFGCRQVPAPSTLLKMIIIHTAKCEFLIKPAAALSLMHSGIPSIHQKFWKEKSADEIFTIHFKQVASPEKVISLLKSEPCTRAQECVYNYLVSLVGNMQYIDLRLFLRFVTGCSVCITPCITITYNSLDGAGRHPIAHTCESTLELSVFYQNYDDFSNEFNAYLSSTKEEFCWRMDGLSSTKEEIYWRMDGL